MQCHGQSFVYHINYHDTVTSCDQRDEEWPMVNYFKACVLGSVYLYVFKIFIVKKKQNTIDNLCNTCTLYKGGLIFTNY